MRSGTEPEPDETVRFGPHWPNVVHGRTGPRPARDGVEQTDARQVSEPDLGGSTRGR